jgi:hemolysin activation/secretion protein
MPLYKLFSGLIHLKCYLHDVILDFPWFSVFAKSGQSPIVQSLSYLILNTITVQAQIPPQDIIPPSPPPTIPKSPPKLPPANELLNPGKLEPGNPQPSQNLGDGDFFVKSFQVEGSTIFSQRQLAEVLKPYTNQRLSLAKLFQARSAITQLYLNRGYLTSGAVIPRQTLNDDVVKIQVVEGELEAVNISGLGRLQPDYVRSRIALATQKPLNIPRLLDALRLLQLDPLIGNLSAQLISSSRFGLNVLEIEIQQADSFSSQITLDNSRSPSVGSFRRRFQVTEANLLGLGDSLSVGYSQTNGSNGLDFSYTLPVNPHNGTLSFSSGSAANNIIEKPFKRLDIASNSRYYDLSFKQPVIQTPTENFRLGLSLSQRESETSLLNSPYPLSVGANAKGETRVSAVRFFQEWTSRNNRQVIAARSQFSFGIDAFDATINDAAPDSRFFTWRGQAQWVRLLSPSTSITLQGDIQLADRNLLSTEQFALGGLGSVRGYRQDLLLADNGVLLTAEVSVPVWAKSKSTLHLVPFFDIGTAWNSGGKNPLTNNTLAGVGLGLELASDRIIARLDWGLPLVSVDSRDRTWQESGLYFSITTSPF